MSQRVSITTYQRITLAELTVAATLAAATVPARHVHVLHPLCEWVPFYNSSHSGAPPLGVGALPADAAVPTSFQCFEVAILQRAVRLDGLSS